MKRRVAWSLVAFSACNVGCWEPETCDPERILFEDRALEDAVRRELGQEGGEITKARIEGLRSLSISGVTLESLRGLECATGLESLSLARTGIHDIERIREMEHLRNLDLSGNSIDDWAPLGQLPRLETLDVHDSSFGDIDVEWLRSMAVLRSLHLGSTRIRSLTPLSGLPALESLVATGNNLYDSGLDLSLAPMLRQLDLSSNELAGTRPGSLPGSLINLTLSRNKLSDTAVLQGAVQLTTLDLTDNPQLRNIHGARDLPRLHEVDLRRTNVGDLSPLIDHEELFLLDLSEVAFDCPSQTENLDILHHTVVEVNRGELRVACTPDCAEIWGGHAYVDLCGVCDDDPSNDHVLVDPGLRDAVAQRAGGLTASGVQRVTELSVDDATIRDLSGMECLVNLERLSLTGNLISELFPLAGLTALKYLNLRSNEVLEIDALGQLTGLTHLNLQDNHIRELQALSGLTRLTLLDLSENELIDITALGPLTALEDLALFDNNISDLGPLGSMSSLLSLDVGNNDIVDLAPLSSIAGLLDLTAQGNAIADPAPLTANTELVWLDLRNNLFVCEDPYVTADLNTLGEMVVLHNDGTIRHDCL